MRAAACQGGAWVVPRGDGMGYTEGLALVLLVTLTGPFLLLGLTSWYWWYCRGGITGETRGLSGWRRGLVGSMGAMVTPREAYGSTADGLGNSCAHMAAFTLGSNQSASPPVNQFTIYL